MTWILAALAAAVLVAAVAVMTGLMLRLGGIVETLERIQEHSRLVAKDLVAAQKVVEGVASDLSEAHNRAAAIAPDANPGEAADAASRTPPTEPE